MTAGAGVPEDLAFTTEPDLAAAQDGTDAAAPGTCERRPCGMGSTGPRLFDWALVATSDPCQVLLIGRLIIRPDQLAYLSCYVPDPAQIRLPCLAIIAGRRWPVASHRPPSLRGRITRSWICRERGIP